MARKASQQSTYSKGELDPDLSERLDLEHLYNSMAKATNCVFRPQGGFSDRGGFQLVSDADVLASGVQRRLRQRIVPIPITADNLTAINGGTTANLVDQDVATVLQTNAVTAAYFVLVEVDLTVATRVDFVDVIAFKSELADKDEALSIEYWDGAAWVTFADALDVPASKHIRMTSRTRRFGTTPGGPRGLPVSSRNWRVVARNAIGIGRVSIGGLRFWQETSILSPVRVIEVSRDKATNYQLVVTQRNIDVFQAQRYVASIALPVSSQQVAEIGFAGGFDTKLVLHEMIETQRIVRQGSAGEWDISAAPFINVPTMPESVVFRADQDEIQSLDVTALLTGKTFVLFLGDQMTRSIVGNSATLAADVVTALGQLAGVASTAADFEVTLTAGILRVRFTGGNGKRAWPLLSAIALDGTALPATKVVQEGVLSTGKFFSKETGWPRTAAFVQQRLWVAGFRSAPTSSGFSNNPNIWNFQNTGTPLTADLAFFNSLDVKEVETINAVFVGRDLQIFTEVGEWYGETRTLDATKPINWIRASGHGVARGTPLLFADGATLFVQQGGETLRDFLYDATGEAAYSAEPLTVLAPHQLTGVVDLAHRKARSVRDGNLICMVNSSGAMAVVTLLRKQQVIAGAPWSTAGGGFRAVVTSIDHQLYAVIERNGAYWLEKWTPDVPLDWATRSVGASRTIVTGAGYLEGRSDVWAIADGDLVGPLTVTGGQFVLEKAAQEVIFGLEPAWGTRSHVIRDKLQNSQPFRGPGRIYEIELSLKASGGVRVGTNGAAHRDVPLIRTGDKFKSGGPLQTEDGGNPTLPTMQRLYTGDVLITGLLGVADKPYFELSRPGPVPVTVKAVRYEVAGRGDQFGGA